MSRFRKAGRLNSVVPVVPHVRPMTGTRPPEYINLRVVIFGPLVERPALNVPELCQQYSFARLWSRTDIAPQLAFDDLRNALTDGIWNPPQRGVWLAKCVDRSLRSLAHVFAVSVEGEPRGGNSLSGQGSSW